VNSSTCAVKHTAERGGSAHAAGQVVSVEFNENIFAARSFDRSYDSGPNAILALGLRSRSPNPAPWREMTIDAMLAGKRTNFLYGA
jgi:hypothetical protein